MIYRCLYNLITILKQCKQNTSQDSPQNIVTRELVTDCLVLMPVRNITINDPKPAIDL